MITKHPLLVMAILTAAGGLRAQGAADSLFGSTEHNTGGLIGMFYDLKQTQKGEPVQNGNKPYTEVVGEFIDTGWDEYTLRQYYRVTRPLYATQVFIPEHDAAAAPAAFGVANVVNPSQWMVHYKGQVRAKVSGRYRFMGVADDVLAAAVNGKTVLVGCHRDVHLKTVWTPPEAINYVDGMVGPVIFGDWFELKRDEIFDLDVIVGEIPGGGFGAWLMFQKQGETYEMHEGLQKHTKFPVFQVERKELDPNVFKWGKTPMFSIEDKVYFEGVR